MGLRERDGCAKGPGLAGLLEGSPPRERGVTMTALGAIRLASSLQSAVEYVLHAGDVGGVAGGTPPLVSEGRIDYAAVTQHLQQAVQGASGEATQSPRTPTAAQAVEAEPPPPQQQQQQPSGIGGGGGSGGQSPDQPPLLEAASPPTSPTLPVAAAVGASSSSGRLGPAEVTIVEARGACDIQGCSVMSRTNFSTVRSSTCVFKGKWMYEVQLGSSGIMQVGWTTLQARFNNEEGVGDTHDSYAYDGRRKMCWHVSNRAYGEYWTAGDIITSCIDLDAGTMRFFRNGKDLGVAFDDIRRGMPGLAFFAGISLSFSERCEVNFGARPFLHPVDGYRPLEQQQGQHQLGDQLAAARYLAGCLGRLMDVSTASPAAAGAAEAAAAAAAGEAGLEAGVAEGGEYGGEEGQQAAALAAAAAVAEVVAAEAGLLPTAAGQRSVSGGLLPDADMLAALAAAAGEPGSSKAAVTAAPAAVTGSGGGGEGAGGGSGGGASSGTVGPAIRMDDRVLLGAVLAHHLGPLCFEPYIVEAVLLPLLDHTAGELTVSDGIGSSGGGGGGTGGFAAGVVAGRGPGAAHAGSSGGGGSSGSSSGGSSSSSGSSSGGGSRSSSGAHLGRQRLQQLLELLAVMLEEEEMAALVATSCQVLSRRLRGSIWSLAELPGSAMLSALHLWSAMLDNEDVMTAWLASDGWLHQLEQLLAVRQPSEDDLAELMADADSTVRWTEDGLGVARNERSTCMLVNQELVNIGRGLEQVTHAGPTGLVARLAGRGIYHLHGVGQVEAAQADLLLHLWLAPGSSSGIGSSGGSTSLGRRDPHQSQVPSQEDAREPGTAASGQLPGQPLRQFLRYLIGKNRGAMRHIPPPGLSDQTALLSTVFALLRLMNEQVSASLPVVPAVQWDPAITFLQGGALGGGEDPYWDAGRLGGTLSHLAREHPPTEEDRRPLEAVPVGGVVTYTDDAPLRLAGHALQGPSFSDVWLRDRLLMLCHLSAAPLMRGSLSHLQAMQTAMASLQSIAASRERGQPSSAVLEEARRQLQQEFMRSLRAHEWAQCWLLSPSRQQAAFLLSVSTAQLLHAVSSQRQGLLRYVPELYISSMLDMVHAISRCEPVSLDHEAMQELGLHHIIDCVLTHLEDDRIVSPEAQSRLLNMVIEGTQEPDLLRELVSSGGPLSHCRLVPAMMRLFGRPHMWAPVSNFFAMMVEGRGFLHPPTAFPPAFELSLNTLRDLFKSACLTDPELCSRFLHHVFDYVNRMLTELVASLESMDSNWTRGGGSPPSPQLMRLLTSTADYVVVLLRVLELVAEDMPQVFLEGSDMNVTRLAEVLGFALPQFIAGGAHRALQRVASNRQLSRQLRLRDAHILQPLAGILITLSQAERRRWQQQQEEEPWPAAGASSAAAPPSGSTGAVAAAAAAEAAQEAAQTEVQQQQQQEAAADAAAGVQAQGEQQRQQQQEAAQPPPRSQQQQPAQGQPVQQRARRQSLVMALEGQAALTPGILRVLMKADLETEPLSGEDAGQGGGEGEGPGEDASPAERRRRHQSEHALLHSAVAGLLGSLASAAAMEAAAAAARSAAAAAAGDSCQPGGAEEAGEAPEEFLDPILMTLMQDPVLLPDSRVSVERSTIERHLMSSATDPFSRAPLSKEQLIPNDELRQQIKAWQQEQRRRGLSGSSLA